ncbi:alpha/beta fold hydrolase [Henriciella aquimarina]|uniref:alpha/beta fold hydrolase n=1 Tax=Henriciella aquimarina TaxID=545261 RepID=UPI0009FE3895|nr:alpha/beta hydrolase [Henriciella aquimarina]
MQTEDVHYRSADGLTLYAKSYGPTDAPLTALCMHGLTRNHKDFEPMIAALGDLCRFVSVDVRGRARSEWASDPETYTPAVYAGDMAALLDHLKLDKVALIGTSMGGLMSMVMASTIPDRIQGIVMNDIGPVVEQAGLDRIAGYANTVEPEADWQAAAATVERVQADIFPDLSGEDWMAFAKRTYRELDDGRVLLDYDPAITRTVGEVKPDPEVQAQMWKLFEATHAVPLLLIRGEMSDILSPETASRMIAQHPDARLVTVPRVGHAPLLDEPEAVSAIADLLKRLGASSQ